MEFIFMLYMKLSTYLSANLFFFFLYGSPQHIFCLHLTSSSTMSENNLIDLYRQPEKKLNKSQEIPRLSQCVCL